MLKAIPVISKKILVVSIAALFLVSMVFFVLPGKIYADDAALLAAADAAVTALEGAIDTEDLTVEANLTAAEALVTPAQTAVNAALAILGIAPIAGRLTAAEGAVTAARTAFDTAVAGAATAEAAAVDAIFDGVSSTLTGLGVASNIGDVTASNYESFSGLYFEKSIDGAKVGMITFTAALDLSSEATQIFLQDLGTYMIANPGSMKFNASTQAQMKAAGAEIKMYGINALGYTDVPPIIVKDDSGIIIPESDVINYPTLSAKSYDASNGGTLIFTTNHFTQFDIGTAPAAATTTTATTTTTAATTEASGPAINEKPISDYDKTNSGFVNLFYNRLLSRAPEKAGLDAWVARLTGGALTGADLVNQFIFGKECQSIISTYTNEQFITFLYRTLFNRAPDSGGFNAWLARMSAGMTKEGVVNGFTHSLEFELVCKNFGIK